MAIMFRRNPTLRRCLGAQGDPGSPKLPGRSATRSDFGGPDDDIGTLDDDTLADEPQARLILRHQAKS